MTYPLQVKTINLNVKLEVKPCKQEDIDFINNCDMGAMSVCDSEWNWVATARINTPAEASELRYLGVFYSDVLASDFIKAVANQFMASGDLGDDILKAVARVKASKARSEIDADNILKAAGITK